MIQTHQSTTSITAMMLGQISAEVQKGAVIWSPLTPEDARQQREREMAALREKLIAYLTAQPRSRWVRSCTARDAVGYRETRPFYRDVSTLVAQGIIEHKTQANGSQSLIRLAKDGSKRVMPGWHEKVSKVMAFLRKHGQCTAKSIQPLGFSRSHAQMVLKNMTAAEMLRIVSKSPVGELTYEINAEASK